MSQPDHHFQDQRFRPLRAFFEQIHMSTRAIMAVSFVLIVVIMCIGLVPEQASWQVGKAAVRTVQADRSFIYEDSEATQQRQEAALENFQPVYNVNLDQFNSLTLVAIDRAFETLTNTITVQTAPDTAQTTADAAQAASDAAELDADMGKKREKLEKEFSFDLTEDQWSEFLSYDADQISLLHRQLVAIVSNVMSSGVPQEKLDEAKTTILETIGQSHAMSALDKRILSDIMGMIRLYPTSIIDQDATDKEKKAVLENVEPVRHAVQRDQVIVSKGETVNQQQYDALKALGYTNDSSPIVIALGVLLTVALAFYCMYIFVRFNAAGKPGDWERRLSILYTLMTVIVITFPVFTAIQLGTRQAIISLVGFLIPVPAAAIMASILLSTYAAVFISLILSVLLGVYTGNMFFAFAVAMGSLAAVSQVRIMRRRTDLTAAGLAAGAVMLCAATAYTMLQGFDIKILVAAAGYVVGNSFLSIVLPLGLIPYIERFFDVTTSMTLMELCDPDMPLQRALMQKAPGTYQHSLMVANLAEAAALRIGADAQLVRTAAYYHDVGKIKRPAFFSENQMTGVNPHDKIAPTLSTLIITTHVKDSVALAREAHLPTPVIDIISQHHGNSVVGFFYHKAHEKDPSLSKDGFRYNASRPQTREAAVLMMADTVEAAVRSKINDLSRAQVGGFIHQLIQDKFDDNQFVECDLTFRDISEITDELIRVTNSVYHKRIVYPDKKSLGVK